MTADVTFEVNADVSMMELEELFRVVWGEARRFDEVLERSLAFVAARRDRSLVGFLNVAWDGGAHASIFDLVVHPDHRRAGIASEMLRRATAEARGAGVAWLHLDFRGELAPLYQKAGFEMTTAGLMKLR